MDDLVRRFLAAQQAFTERVAAVSTSQWELPTPAREWSVADLIAHVVVEHRWAPPLLRGLDVESSAKVVDGARRLPVDGGIGADIAQSWNEAAAGSAEAVTAGGAMSRTVALLRGDTPAADYVAELIFDLVVHSWDLGRAIGHDHPLPADVVDAVWEDSKNFGDLSSSGLFDLPVQVSCDAPTIHRLVAMTGRDPG